MEAERRWPAMVSMPSAVKPLEPSARSVNLPVPAKCTELIELSRVALSVPLNRPAVRVSVPVAEACAPNIEIAPLTSAVQLLISV